MYPLFQKSFSKTPKVSTFIRHKTLILFLFFDACNFSSRLSFYLKFHWGHVESNCIFNLEFTDLPARNVSILIFQIHLVDYFFSVLTNSLLECPINLQFIDIPEKVTRFDYFFNVLSNPTNLTKTLCVEEISHLFYPLLVECLFKHLGLNVVYMDIWSNDLVVKVLDSLSRGRVFKTIAWPRGRP